MKIKKFKEFIFESIDDTDVEKQLPNENSKKAAALIAAAKQNIIMKMPFFGHVSINFKVIEDNNIKTMATDGKAIYYNPNFTVNELKTLPKVQFVVVHEILHNILLHFTRIKGRNHHLQNVAADYALNQLIVDIDSFMEMPEMGLIPGVSYDNFLKLREHKRTVGDVDKFDFKDLTKNVINGKVYTIEDYKLHYNFIDANAETIYLLIEKARKEQDKKQQDGQGQDGQGQGGQGQGGQGQGGELVTGTEEAIDELNEPEGNPQEIAENIKRSVSQNKSRSKGDKNTKGLDEQIGNVLAGKTNQKQVLKLKTLPSKSVDTKQNRRFLGRELYLPKDKISLNTGNLVVAFDTSGSMNEELIRTIMGEVNKIISDIKPPEVDILFFHDYVYNTITYKNNKMPDFKIQAGGTNFQAVFDKVTEKYKNKTTKIEKFLIFTDGYDTIPHDFYFKDKLIQCILDNPVFKQPYGTVIHIDTNEL